MRSGDASRLSLLITLLVVSKPLAIVDANKKALRIACLRLLDPLTSSAQAVEGARRCASAANAAPGQHA